MPSPRLSLLLALGLGCVPRADGDDDVGTDTTSSQGSSDTSGPASTSTSSESDSTPSDTSEGVETSATGTGETDTTTGETGASEPDAWIPAGSAWFEHTHTIAHRRVGDDELLLLGGHGVVQVQPPSSAAGVLALELDGTLRWQASEPWPELVRMVVELVELPAGGTWVTGWSLDADTLADGPSWIWLGELDFAGAWVWLSDTPLGQRPRATARHPSGRVALVHDAMGGSGLHGFEANAAWAWSSEGLADAGRWAKRVVALPEGFVVAGFAFDADWQSTRAWLRRLDLDGAPLDERELDAPPGALEQVVELAHDEPAGTLELVVAHGELELASRWLTLDAASFATLATRELGPGSGRALRVDGEGGIWVLLDGTLQHFDAAGNLLDALELGLVQALAFDSTNTRVFVLRGDARGETTGIAIYAL